MSNWMENIVSVLTAIIGLAIIAVIVSQRAATSSVIKSAGNAFSSAISAATAPVTAGGGPNFTGAAPGYPSFE
jgi:hypothetical protein